MIQRIGVLLWEELFELANGSKHLVKVIVVSVFPYMAFAWNFFAGAYMFFHDNFSSIAMIVMFIIIAFVVLAVLGFTAPG